MATRNIVPRANGEGSIGTAVKHWGNGYFDELNTEKLVVDDIIAKGPVVDVRAFGAVGDGVTDDTAAIQAAIDNADVVYIPAGVYAIDTITISKPTKIIGSGVERNLCVLIAKTTRTNNGIVISNHNYTQIENIVLLKHATGLMIDSSCYVQIKNVTCKECNIGCEIINSSYIIRFENCTFRDSMTDGLQAGLHADDVVSTIDFISCYFASNTNCGFNGRGRCMNFIGGYADSNKIGFHFDVFLQNIAITMIGVDIENNTDYGIDFSTAGTLPIDTPYVNGFTFTGGMITGKASGKACVRLNHTKNYLFWKNMLFDNVRLSNDGYDYTLETPADATVGLKFNNANIECTANHRMYSLYSVGILDDYSVALARVACRKYNDSKIELAAGEIVNINIPKLAYVQSITVTTSESAATLQALANSGGRIFSRTEITSSGMLNVSSGTASVTISNNAENLYLRNAGNSTVSITSITVNCALYE
jgi:hypothetical protein